MKVPRKAKVRIEPKLRKKFSCKASYITALYLITKIPALV